MRKTHTLTIFDEWLLFHFEKNHNFIHFWCLPLLTPQLYVHKIFQEASNTDFQVIVMNEFYYFKNSIISRYQ